MVYVLFLLSILSEVELPQCDQKELKTGWYQVDMKSGVPRFDKFQRKVFMVDPLPIATVKNFKKMEVHESGWDEKSFMLTIWLDEAGTMKWSRATEKAEERQGNMICILDDEILCSPVVSTKITNGATAISREDLSQEDLLKIKEKLE